MLFLSARLKIFSLFRTFMKKYRLLYLENLINELAKIEFIKCFIFFRKTGVFTEKSYVLIFQVTGHAFKYSH